MDYHFLRALADSWVLLAMCLFFLAAIVWALRPGGNKTYRDTAKIPFRHEKLPADDKEERK